MFGAVSFCNIVYVCVLFCERSDAWKLLPDNISLTPAPALWMKQRAGRRILECARVGVACLQPGGEQARGVMQQIRLSILRLDAESCIMRVFNKFSGIQELI